MKEPVSRWNFRPLSPPGRAGPPGVQTLYQERLRNGDLEGDPAQEALAQRLDTLAAALARPPARSWLPGRRPKADAVRGLYIHGEVGRGKTLLMDLFFAAAPIPPKERRHFHRFMNDVHAAIAAARAARPGDPIPKVARDIAARARLLCLDELAVTNIADAMILGRLFTALIEAGCVLVTTSNTPPRGLYRDGLNRDLFLPFVELIESRLDVVELAAAKDYRLEKLAGETLYFTPLGAGAREKLETLWRQTTSGHEETSVTLAVKGRSLAVPRAANGAAWVTFAGLCEVPLGSLDYHEIVQNFRMIFLEGIPVFDPAARDSTRRFITLIDTLYDNGTLIAATAAAPPLHLCREGPLAETFLRTASRLVEMQSRNYVLQHRALPEENRKLQTASF